MTPVAVEEVDIRRPPEDVFDAYEHKTGSSGRHLRGRGGLAALRIRVQSSCDAGCRDR